MSAIAEPFRTYVAQLTGRLPEAADWTGRALPSYLRQRYEPHLVRVDGRVWVVAFLRGDEAPPPPQLMKQLAQMETKVSPPPAGTCLVAEHLPPYLRRRPFVIPKRQLFWPALGSAETAQRPQRLQPRTVDTLSPVAQQVLIALLLGRLPPPVTIGDAGSTLGYTAASISQAVKSLEGSGLVHSTAEGRERTFELRDEPLTSWQRARPLLRSPVRRRLRMREAELPLRLVLRAGESALAAMSDLAAPAEAVFAVSSRAWPKDAPWNVSIPSPDAGTCVIELWRYPPDGTATDGTVDPLSLYLSLQGIKDERVQLALEQMMERISW